MSIDEIFKQFRTNQQEIEITIQDLKNNLKQYLDKIVLYGAGSAGIAFLHYLNDVEIYPRFFSDGDVEKHGKKCEGVEIIPPSEIVDKLGKDVLVIVTINTDGKSYCRDFKQALLKEGHQGVHKTLEELGCTNILDYVYFRKCFSMFRGGRYNLPACPDAYLMAEHEEEIKKVYELLADQTSKEIFCGIVQFRMLNGEVGIPTVSEEKQYFEYDLFPRRSDEVFLDCGACGGSSLKIFLNENHNQFERYYGIEPDTYNYDRLVRYISSLPLEVQSKICTINKAVFDNEGFTNFFVLNGPGTFASSTGETPIRTKTIDNILTGNKVTYIKMNIEGSEVPALRGAEKTIRLQRPRMAIMGYHKTSDLWEVPLLMKKYNPGYKIWLKSYMRNIAFCYFAE